MTETDYRIDFDDEGKWYVFPPAPDARRIPCEGRVGAILTYQCIVEADEPSAEFERIYQESKR